MHNSLPQAPTSNDLMNVMAPASAQAPAPHITRAPGEDTPDAPVEKVSEVQAFVDNLPEASRKLYMSIRREMDEKQKLSILMVTGELTYTYDLKGIPITFKLLDGKEKYNVDQYQFGKDPLRIFKEEDRAEIEQRMEDYDEEKREATIAFLERQSLDSVAKRTTLITLALAISSFNSKKLGDAKAAVARIERFQAPIIEKLSDIYSTFETVVVHMLQDDAVLKK